METADEKYVKRLSLLFILIGLTGCTDSTPSVSLLENLLSPSNAQSPQFADAGISGAKQVTTADSYTGRFVIHSGTAGNTIKTSDNYQLTVRKVSF